VKRVTIRDVAARAGVAPSTVSFVLNGKRGPRISAETRQLVLTAADELNYVPQYMASLMRTGTAKTIGVVALYDMERMYFQDMITGIVAAARAEDHGVLNCSGTEHRGQPDYLQYHQSGRIDGVVFLASAHTESNNAEDDLIQQLREHRVPFVTVYGHTRQPGVEYVNIDFYQCGYAACEHLLTGGVQRPGYLAPLDWQGVAPFRPRTELDKQQGYTDALRKLSDHEPRVYYLPRSFEGERKDEVRAILRKAVEQDRIDAFVTCWATYGMQLISVANEMGWRVPEDLRIISLDTIPYLDYTVPSLSSMQLPFRSIAVRATQDLIRHHLEGGTDDTHAETILLPCDLMVRRSSAPVPAQPRQ
jgi:LacI family transcriptional regulator